MRRRVAVALTVLALVLLVGWEYVSPAYTLRTMRDAAARGDAAAVSSHVDYPALRNSIKGGVNYAIARRIQNDEGSPSAIAMAIASRAAGSMVDRIVNPESLALALADPVRADSPLARTWRGEIGIERRSLSEFVVVNTDDPKAPRLAFTRDWPGWKLSGIEMPDTTEIMP